MKTQEDMEKMEANGRTENNKEMPSLVWIFAKSDLCGASLLSLGPGPGPLTHRSPFLPVGSQQGLGVCVAWGHTPA